MKYIVLLRGVMPSGKNRVPMSLLRESLIEAGFLNTKTWIQSGNVTLDSHLVASEVASHVHDTIQDKIGADLKIIVKTPEEVEQVLFNNPFGEGCDMPRVFLPSSIPNPKKRL